MRLAGVLAGLAVVAVLAGCGGDDEGGQFDQGPMSAPVADEVQFGETYTFPSGSTVRVWAFNCHERIRIEPDPVQPMLGVKVEVTNNTSVPVSADVVSSAIINGQSFTGVIGDFVDCPYPELGVLFPGETARYVDNFKVTSVTEPLRIEVVEPRPEGDYSTPNIVYFTGVPAVDVSLVEAPTRSPATREAPATSEVCDYQVNDCVPPDMNVGPDGVCTATPCGSNGRRPNIEGG